MYSALGNKLNDSKQNMFLSEAVAYLGKALMLPLKKYFQSLCPDLSNINLYTYISNKNFIFHAML